jgi:hypothetical protein
MVHLKTPGRTRTTRRKARQRSLLVLVGLPLVVLHLGMLLERALHHETLDAMVVLRWSLAVALLAVLKRAAPRVDSLRSPAMGIAAVLIFGLIHLPVAAPEPSLPLAATGMGLALSLFVVDRWSGSLSLDRQSALLAGPASSAWSPVVPRDALKDRAPPVSR